MIDLSLLQDFITEANEHLEEMEASLLKLEKDPDDKEIMNDIFRAIHTIKGASQFVGLPRISELSHKMENLLDLLRQGEKELNQDITDTLIDTRDRLTQLTHELEENQDEASEIDDLLERILTLSGIEVKPEESPEEEEASPPSEDDADLQSELEAALDTSVLEGDLDTSILDGSEEEETPSTSPEEVSDEDELIRKELAEETYDEELFGIFIQQACNNFNEIVNLAEKMSDPQKAGEPLDRCITCLINLRSSANYMGYTTLVSLYDGWQGELIAAKNSIEDGQDTSLDFITAYTERLAQLIPELTEQVVEEPAAPEKGTEAPSPDKTETAQIVINEDAIKNEISEEVYDEELFTIFSQQVKVNIGAIQKALTSFASSNNLDELIENCRRSLDNLKSSANYMGYSNLVSLYDKWQGELGEESSGTITDFIKARLDQVIDIFSGVIEPPDEEELEDLFAEPVPSDLEAAKEDKATDEDELFAALSDSVDDAMADVKESGVEPLHGILEEMLFADEDQPTAEIEPEPKKKTKAKAKKKAKEEKAVKPEEPVAPPEPEEPVTPERRKADRRTEDRRQEERRLGNRRKEGGESTYKQSIRVDSEKIDSLMNQVGELVVSRAYFAQIFNYLRDFQQLMKEEVGLDSKGMKPLRELSFKLGEATVALGRVSNELQEGVMKIRMLPVAQLFNRYPRLVRDLVHKTDKKVDLVIRGEDTELDKMVIEEISDPLIHIIRNAVDHGLESPAARKKAGKPETGTLTLEAYHESNHIVIEISDDGRGIDVEKVKQKAFEKGLISEQELGRISDIEARRFIMMPGFSTADTPTETSGRGVGMDVIKTNIEKLNGTVEVDSEFGARTMIRIKIPLTLAIIQALMVRVGDELFTVPLSVVEETLRIFEHETSTIEGVEVIHLRDTTMPIFRLADIFGIEGASQDISQSFVVIVTTGMQEIGIVVDELIGQEEVVIKPLVDYLREESGFSGATIIGDGRISLILDIYELVKMTADKQVERTLKHSKQRGKRTKVIKKSRKNKVKPAESDSSETIH
jgi:two-component system chemotaxis sensor kinase CheA